MHAYISKKKMENLLSYVRICIRVIFVVVYRLNNETLNTSHAINNSDLVTCNFVYYLQNACDKNSYIALISFPRNMCDVHAREFRGENKQRMKFNPEETSPREIVHARWESVLKDAQIRST